MSLPAVTKKRVEYNRPCEISLHRNGWYLVVGLAAGLYATLIKSIIRALIPSRAPARTSTDYTFARGSNLHVKWPEARVVFYFQSVFDPPSQCHRSFPHSLTPFETSVKGMFYIQRERRSLT